MTGSRSEDDVVVVVGASPDARRRYAGRLAHGRGCRLVSASDASVVAGLRSPAVAEFPLQVPVTEILGEAAAEPGIRVRGLVCVVDATRLRGDLDSDAYALHPADGRLLARSSLVAAQIEHASVVIVTRWRTVGREELATLLALVGRLGPRARVRLHRGAIDSSGAVPDEASSPQPGWVGILNGDDPGARTARVSALRYENLRPLHPGRLSQALDQIDARRFGTLVRSAGFCRFATRPGITGLWEQAGRVISFEPVSRDDDLDEADELLAVGQDLALIGVDLDHAGLVAELDRAVLTDAELAAGPAHWARFPDPFPAWAHAPGPDA
jgi:G3E family GTPase